MMLVDLVKDTNYIYLVDGVKSSGSVPSLDLQGNKQINVIYDVFNKTKIVINVKKGSNIKLLEIFNNVNNDIDLDINVEEDATLDYVSLRKANEKVNINVNVNLLDNAKFYEKNINSFSGEASIKQINNINCKGSSMESFGVILNVTSNTQRFDYTTIHLGEASLSKMRNFVINKNASITHMDTNGVIKKGIKGVVISQKTKGILLDYDSEISANPLLTIDEFDCNASHGASIGAIDEEELYYLMSRGLSKNDAEKLIVNGFVDPFIKAIEDEKIQEEVKENISKLL